jgi:hypothetical protein
MIITYQLYFTVLTVSSEIKLKSEEFRICSQTLVLGDYRSHAVFYLTQEYVWESFPCAVRAQTRERKGGVRASVALRLVEETVPLVPVGE